MKKFKAVAKITLRESVSDAAGNAVMRNTKVVAPDLHMTLLRIGKSIDMWFEAESEELAREQMEVLCDRMLANTVVENWSYELEETEESGLGDVANPMDK